MLGSLSDTALDFAASLVTLFGVRFAAMPAHRNHRFGHGKAEALVALFQAVLIIVASIGIALRAIERIGSGATTANAEYGIGVSLKIGGAHVCPPVTNAHLVSRLLLEHK